MKNKRNYTLLFFVTVVGIGLHVLALFFLQNLPVGSSQKTFENIVARENEAFEALERHRRSALLAEIFDQLTEEIPEVKEELHELKAEYSPSIELSFPTPSTEIVIEEFSFESDALNLPNFEEGKILLYEGSSLISTLPNMTTLEPPPLAQIQFDDDPYETFGTLAGSEQFDVQVDFTPKRFRPGYVFKVTFLPKADVVFKRIRQNFFFLLDRSNSIARHRYYCNKKAVSEALELLKPGDRFNILIFDDHVVRFSDDVVLWEKETVEKAREFLDRHGHGGYFAATELYSSLGKIIPTNVDEHEVNAAILLSDGDTYLSQEKQRVTIGGWTTRNSGKVSLYTVASGSGNNLPLLELLSAFNKGTLVYAQDHNRVSDRLCHLIRTIQHPIGKQMIATAITQDKHMTVLLQPKHARIPDLYQNRPFVIYGSTNKLSDFVLFLQGRYYDRRFDIKKKITFNQAKIGSYGIEREWTQLRVQEFYERYFEEGKMSYIEEAKQILAPHNLSILIE